MHFCKELSFKNKQTSGKIEGTNQGLIIEDKSHSSGLEERNKRLILNQEK